MAGATSYEMGATVAPELKFGNHCNHN